MKYLARFLRKTEAPLGEGAYETDETSVEEGSVGFVGTIPSDPPTFHEGAKVGESTQEAPTKPTEPPPRGLPWRQHLPWWPDAWRERWGRRAVELEETGIGWREAEERAFVEILAERAAAPDADVYVEPDEERPEATIVDFDRTYLPIAEPPPPGRASEYHSDIHRRRRRCKPPASTPFLGEPP